MPGRFARREETGWVASGHVNHEREFLRCAKLGDQPFKRLAQVSHSILAGIAFTVGAHTGTQLSVGSPHAIFVLLHDVGDVHRLRHKSGSLRRPVHGNSAGREARPHLAACPV